MRDGALAHWFKRTSPNLIVFSYHCLDCFVKDQFTSRKRSPMVCNAKANWNRVTADPACTDCVYRFVPKRTKWRSWWPGGTNHRSKHGVCSGRCAHRLFHGDIWRRFIAQRKRRCRRVLIRFGNRPRPRSQVGSTCVSDIPPASSSRRSFSRSFPLSKTEWV